MEVRSQEDHQALPVEGVIVVIAKCPLPGLSKTRLSGLLGNDGSADFARAMLSDVVEGISHHPILQKQKKVLSYAPSNDDAKNIMAEILESLNLRWYEEETIPPPLVEKKNKMFDNHTNDDSSFPTKIGVHDDYKQWLLLPMTPKPNPTEMTKGHENSEKNQSNFMAPDIISIRKDLKSSDLGMKLMSVLSRVRRHISISDHNTYNPHVASSEREGIPTVFLGMDSPELPLDEIAHAIVIASRPSNNNSQGNSKSGRAYLNPADDGGYGMICLPSHAPPNVFNGIRWSDPLTTISQLKALTDQNIDVTIGNLMHDIDEPHDLIQFAERLCHDRNKNNKDKNKSFYAIDYKLPALNKDVKGINMTLTKQANRDDVLETDKFKTNHHSTGSCNNSFAALNKIGLIIKKDL